jgi:hypothetical protein
MKTASFLRAFASTWPFAFASLLVACGGKSTASPDASEPFDATEAGDVGGETADDVAVDADAPVDAPDCGRPPLAPLPDGYPAFAPWVPVLQNSGGHVMKSPVIVTVTWVGDKLVDTLESFGDKIGGSAFWAAITGEYGVGSGVSGLANHVRIPDAPPTKIADTEIAPFIIGKLKDPTSGWPAPTADTVYVLYISNSTTFLYQGRDVCGTGIGGYHANASYGGQTFAYAVLPQCSVTPFRTGYASHEIGEAATDPYPSKVRGYEGFDDAHAAWTIFQGDQTENADACEFYREALYHESCDLPFIVQRQWSNKSAAAGRHPCVPAPAGLYFNTTPLDLEDVIIDFSAYTGSATLTTKGYHVKVGETRSFSIGFYSEGPTPSGWSVSVEEGNPMFGSSTSHLSGLTIDPTSGKNGDKATVTLTVDSVGTKTGAELITIVSTMGTTKHFMPILIGSQ